MARRTKEAALETRNRILDTAERVFLKHGVSHTSLADVAAAANVKRCGTILLRTCGTHHWIYPKSRNAPLTMGSRAAASSFFLISTFMANNTVNPSRSR